MSAFGDMQADLADIESRVAELDTKLGNRPAHTDAADAASFSALLDRLAAQQSSPFAPAAASAGAGSGPAAKAPAFIEGLISQNALAYGVDPALIKAIVVNESGFNPGATSPVGAQGLMQLMPLTASALGVTNAYDPVQNIAGGTRYLRDLLQKFGGNVPLAVAAYNAGPGAVESHGGVPPYAETQKYVADVMSSYNQYHKTQRMN